MALARKEASRETRSESGGTPRALVSAVAHGFRENDLLTYASAISWQVLFALIPLALAGLALLGFFSLEHVWEQDVAPRVRENVSEAAFALLETTVKEILGSRRGFWLTLGVALAIWEVSGAVRAIMGALTRIYGGEEARPFWNRVGLSVLIAAAAASLLGVAVTAIHFGPRIVGMFGSGAAVDIVGGILRYGLAVVVLLTLVWILLRLGPATRQPVSWVTASALFVVAGWILSSVAFGWYVQEIADYESAFGNLAVAIVLMTYLYISAIVFLGGVQLDAIARARLDGTLGEHPAG